jgi:histidine triad (HIT) family protein
MDKLEVIPKPSLPVIVSAQLLTEVQMGDGSVHEFSCDEVLSGRTPVHVVAATDHILAFHHTRPYWPVHLVVIPKLHIPSLPACAPQDGLLIELLGVVQRVAAQVTADHGACRVLTNLGAYLDSKQLHWHVAAGEPRHSGFCNYL